ncbi:LacI family DNA-binding transcriptional regulator [Hydrogenoanaerobacterium sp.]|uniref:LacI family DNA-binding transcriptional regulator n=1 Tax=Hydrogenoanaerobacterium sp. TaxID=2953763 RepID=UPI00289A6538|nr:LacI family DNA-binding transcriptional regulator [Hydrogenoanaerobacterium sp.]
MRTTIKDIAAKTNLSVTTVSLVLNNKPSKISQKTKELVLKTAKELHYRPNQLAVGLIKKRTKTIGLIVSDIRNNFFSSLAKGIEDECRRNGWTLILCNTSDNHQRDIEYIHVLASKSVDGILYCMSVDSTRENFQKSYDLLGALNIPFVMIDRSYPMPNRAIVRLDHIRGGYMATQHLLELGHKRIACVTGPNYLEDSRDRLDGYKKALMEAGIVFDESLIFEGGYDMGSGINAVHSLIGKDFSAIFAFNDMMAYGVYKGLKAHGLCVPADISVIGYDDIFLSEILEVPLTTIKQPIELMGCAATKKLISIIEHEPLGGDTTIFEPELIVRKSTTAYPQN